MDENHLSRLKQRKKSSGAVLMRDDSTKRTLFCSLRFSLTRIYQIPSDEILSVMVMPGQNGDFIPATAWGETTSDPTQIRLRPPRWRTETWRKRITAITFGNGRKLISPHRDASSNTLFTISLEGICSRLCCEDSLYQSRGGGGGRCSDLPAQKGLPPLPGGTISLQHLSIIASSVFMWFHADSILKTKQMRMKRNGLLTRSLLMFPYRYQAID